jgi:(R,R)-butanediol dehydrogenase/meso-butanediol dehydrogenase/diacetyl reductase
MRAAYYQGNRTFTVEKSRPQPPGPDEVRLQVAYCGICGTDLHIYHGSMDRRVRIPQVIGHEASATVADVGRNVRGFVAGEKVVVRPLDNRAETPADRGFSHICRGLKFIGIDSPGAFQSSWTVPAFTLHKVPSQIDLQMAALVEPLAVGCHDVRIGDIQKGEFVVVLGGGPIGILVALVARAAGAAVLLSEINGFRREFARSLALETVDPSTVDLAGLCEERTSGRGADAVFEVSGSKAAALEMTKLPGIRGRLIMVAVHPQPVEISLFQFFWKELQLRGARVYEPEDYEKAIELISGRVLPLDTFITRVEPLERLGEAFGELDGTPEAMKVMINCTA